MSISQWLLKFDRVLCILAVCNFCEGVALLLHTFLVSQVKANSRALGARLMKYGYKLVTDGTDNHLVLWDMRKEVKLTYMSLPVYRPDLCNQYGLCTSYIGDIMRKEKKRKDYTFRRQFEKPSIIRGHHDVCVQP